MANIDFPPGAINGTTHTQNDKTWIYDGTSWSLVASLIPDASTTVSGLVNTSTQSFSGDKKFTNNLDVVGGLGVTGQSVFRNNIEIQSGGLGITGTVSSDAITIRAGGIGVTGQSVFRNNIEIQSGGLGITGGVTITGSGLTVISGGIGITGQSIFRNNVTIQSGGLGVTGGIGVTGGVTITGSGLAIISGGIGVTGQSVFRNNVEIQSGGLGVTGQSVFRNNVEIQSSGLGVTGQSVFRNNIEIQSGGLGVTGTISSDAITIRAGGIGVTGQSVFRNNVEIQSGGLGITGTLSSDGIIIRAGGLGVTGQSVFRNNIEIQSGGIGVTGGVTITGSGLTVISGGMGVTGQSVFRNNVEIQSGGLGVTGGIGVTGRLTIHAGGLGVTGAAVFNSSISAGSLSLSTPLPLSSGGTGLGSTSLANYILGMNSSSLGLEYKQIVEGSNITITHNTNSITIAASSSSATPGGPNGAIQYNGSNTLAGTSTFLWDNTSQRIDIKNTNAIGTGTTAGFLLQNSTASTVSVQMQFSPGIEFAGRAWKTSGSPATDTFVRYLEMVEVTSGGTPTGAITWKSAIHNASNQGPTYVKRAEISTNYGLGIYETTGVYKSSIINSASATTDIYYTLPAALPSLNQSLAVTGISVSSVTLSWISSGTVASGASGALAYYAGTGTTVDDATGLAYSTSGTHMVITSQTATDVPLRVDGHASSSVNLFQVRKGTNSQFLINSTGELIFSSSMRGGTNTFTKTLGAGDIGLDNGTTDTPAVLFYLENNKNFGIDAFAGSGVTRFRIVKELNESGGTELWSIDQRGVVYRSGYAAGETIKTQTYNYSDLGMSGGGDPVSVTSASYQTIATATYTPTSSSSYLWIEFSATYDFNNGSTADEFAANIEVGGSEIVNVFQKFVNASGGGTRSGVLFPLAGRYTNSVTSALTITVRVKRNSGDDPVRIFGNAGSGFMRIQEIGR